MKKVGGLFTCSALALMAFAVLPLSAAELTHRWSFNGDFADSVGGADAVKCGTYVSLYGNCVHLGGSYQGNVHGTGYVDLGTNRLDTTASGPITGTRRQAVPSSTTFPLTRGTRTISLCRARMWWRISSPPTTTR